MDTKMLKITFNRSLANWDQFQKIVLFVLQNPGVCQSISKLSVICRMTYEVKGWIWEGLYFGRLNTRRVCLFIIVFTRYLDGS